MQNHGIMEMSIFNFASLFGSFRKEVVLMPKEFGKNDSSSSVTSGRSRRRRRRATDGGVGRGSATPWNSGVVVGSSTPAVTSQLQATYSSGSEALAAGVLGAAALGSTVTAAVLSTSAPTTLVGALSSAATGISGVVNATSSVSVTSAAVSAVTSAVTSTTLNASHIPSGPDEFVSYLCGILGLGCLVGLVIFEVGASLFGDRRGRDNGDGMFNLDSYYPDSGYGSSSTLDNISLASGLGSTGRIDQLAVVGGGGSVQLPECDGDSLGFRGEAGEGPSETVGVGSVSLAEVIVTQHMGGGFPPLYLGEESSSDGSSESLLGCMGGDEPRFGVVTQPIGSGIDSGGDRDSVREAFLGVGRGDTNRGPGGKCKKKLHHLER